MATSRPVNSHSNTNKKKLMNKCAGSGRDSIPVDNQYQTHLMLLVILTALNVPVWLIVTNLNKADFQYSLFV